MPSKFKVGEESGVIIETLNLKNDAHASYVLKQMEKYKTFKRTAWTHRGKVEYSIYDETYMKRLVNGHGGMDWRLETVLLYTQDEKETVYITLPSARYSEAFRRLFHVTLNLNISIKASVERGDVERVMVRNFWHLPIKGSLYEYIILVLNTLQGEQYA